MGGRVGAARWLAHVTPVRARLTAAAPGDAGALRSPGAPPGNVSISCRLLSGGARAPSGGAEPSRAAGSVPAPPQVGEVRAPAPAPGLRDPSPLPGRRRLRAAAEGRGRRRLRRLPGASRAARCSPRPRRPSGAGGASPAQVGSGLGRANFAGIAPNLQGTKFAVRPRGLCGPLRLLQVAEKGVRAVARGTTWGLRGAPAARLPGSGGACCERRGAAGGPRKPAGMEA